MNRPGFSEEGHAPRLPRLGACLSSPRSLLATATCATGSTSRRRVIEQAIGRLNIDRLPGDGRGAHWRPWTTPATPAMCIPASCLHEHTRMDRTNSESIQIRRRQRVTTHTPVSAMTPNRVTHLPSCTVKGSFLILMALWGRRCSRGHVSSAAQLAALTWRLILRLCLQPRTVDGLHGSLRSP